MNLDYSTVLQLLSASVSTRLKKTVVVEGGSEGETQQFKPAQMKY